MRCSDNPERDRLVKRALCATSLDEINGAIAALRQWRDAHPGDVGIADAFEQLDHMRLAALDLDASSANALTPSGS